MIGMAEVMRVSGLLGGERYIGRMDGFEIEVLKTYKQEIEKQRIRMNASHNGFIRTCCMQEIDQLRDEMEAIEIEVAG